jgi:hypothetical protein
MRQVADEYDDITAERIWDVSDRSFIEPVVTHPKLFTCTFHYVEAELLQSPFTRCEGLGSIPG